jgi:hypothetical protein
MVLTCNVINQGCRQLAIVLMVMWHLVPRAAYATETKTSATDLAEQVRACRVAHEKQILTEFATLLAIPKPGAHPGQRECDSAPSRVAPYQS